MTLNKRELLDKKINKELEEYIDSLKIDNKYNLIEVSHEITMKSAIVKMLENSNFIKEDEDVEMFLNKPKLLDSLYSDCINTNNDFFDLLEDYFWNYFEDMKEEYKESNVKKKNYDNEKLGDVYEI